MENKEIIITEGNPVNVEDTQQFKGYSMEEMRYQRAVLALRKEFCKAKILQDINHLRHRSILGKSKDSQRSNIGILAKKLLSGLNYLDYALMGASLFGTGKKIYRFFRRK